MNKMRTIANYLSNQRRSAAVGSDEAERGQFVSIAVENAGGGMPPDVAARAFEPFFTTKPIGQGTAITLFLPELTPELTIASTKAAE